MNITGIETGGTNLYSSANRKGQAPAIKNNAPATTILAKRNPTTATPDTNTYTGGGSGGSGSSSGSDYGGVGYMD